MVEYKFHHDVYLPRVLSDECLSLLARLDGCYELTWHAKQRCLEKQVGLPSRIPFQRAKVIEVTTANQKLSKFLIRFTHEGRDVLMGLTPEGRVTTVYYNEVDDRHSTLNRSVYFQRPLTKRSA